MGFNFTMKMASGYMLTKDNTKKLLTITKGDSMIT